MEKQAVKHVVIAGGGTAGWLTAAALSDQLGQQLDITLVESDQIGTIGVGESTIPPMRVFHKLLKIDEQEFMRATNATFKLGISFENWGDIGEEYLHSFGMTGKETWLGEFHHFWLRARREGYAGDFGEYCLEHEAARAGRFQTGKNDPLNYAYHLDATAYARFLQESCQGVRRVEGKIDTVSQEPESGYITSLNLDSGEVIEGDFFIDCTGFRGLLIEQTLNAGFEDWSHWLPCDSAVVAQNESTGPAMPYTRSVAHEAGWRWRIPLQTRVGNGLVYCSEHMADDKAEALLRQEVDGELLTEPRKLQYRTGRRKTVWNKNCLAVGLSGGFVEPLESTAIHLIMMGITRFMQLFPFDGVYPSLVDQYNEQTVEEIERIRDFIILHYRVTRRDDSDFWRYCRTMDIPDSLRHRIDLFQESAQAYQGRNELFRVDSWTQVMLGQGLIPDHYHHVAHKMSPQELEGFLKHFSSSVQKSVKKLPKHSDFIKGYCHSGQAAKRAM